MVLTSLLQCDWIPGVLKIQIPFDSVSKNDIIDKTRELCINVARTAETCLRMLTGASTGVVVSEFTLMLVPDLASRLHWLYHYTIWGPETGVPQCPFGSVWTYSPPGMLSSSCHATSTATVMIYTRLCQCLLRLPHCQSSTTNASVVRLTNAAEEWQQYSQTVASNMTTLYREGGPVFVLTVTSMHLLQW